MTTSSRRRNRKKDEGTETFVLYVAFHSAWSTFINFFTSD